MNALPSGIAHFQSAFVYNDPEKDTKVIDSIESELRKCGSFDFSVAFITQEGVQSVLQTLDNRRHTVKGRILTSDYLNFNEPKALRKLLEFDNLEVRVFPVEAQNLGFHTKGYTFHHREDTSLIIGSSNLTANALSKNKEWNVRISSKDDPSLIESVGQEFERMWEMSEPLTSGWIDSYELRYIQNVNARKRSLFAPARYPGILVPNRMQEEALLNLSRLREQGEKKALLISATGTGKTYLSAFDVKNSEAKKVLFLVHREQILDDAMVSYKNVFGPTLKTGKITGNRKDYDADFIFSTTQSMSKKEIMERFAPEHFDYIVCDEAHHSSTSQYQSILGYFRPRFELGMTATPERSDGADIFRDFDFNIAYEIRLQDALRQEMLCPFHYYGVSDITVEGELLEDKSDFNKLVSEERVKHIMEKARFYGYSGDRVKGLLFCSKVEEGKELSEKLNGKGWRTQFVYGATPQEERRLAVKRLEQKENEDALDYIITVDVFNEGVDIKTVNQVLMLRPTESAIIFIQQLGRGLRKVDIDGEKEFLVVIDFIGNYEKNFLIPIALSGTASLSRESLRRFLRTGSIPGCSTVSFDTVSENSIYESINRTSDLPKLMKEKYLTLVKMLGYEPNLSELFDLMETSTSPIDPLEITRRHDSLNDFKKSLKLGHYKFSDNASLMLKYVSKELMKGFRPHELEMLGNVIEYGSFDFDSFKRDVCRKYEYGFSEASWNSALAVLDGSYSNDNTGGAFIEMEGNKITITEGLRSYLGEDGFKDSVMDCIGCGLKIFDTKYSACKDSLFSHYERYGRYDAIRVLNFTKKIVAQNIGGYFAEKNLHVCPIFITYKKSEDINGSVKYDDRFIDYETFNWMSKNKRSLSSPDVQEILNPDCKLYLFIQKGDDDSSDFYYIGRVTPIEGSAVETTIKNDNGDNLPIVNIRFRIDQPVPEKLFDYFTK
ncbi:MAG: DEAD/DEAH box helicase [archaeon]|nr:DEAD/DEAH box helicase [archaeon]